MCSPTTHGFSWASTDSPPITAWATMPSPIATLSPSRRAGWRPARTARRAVQNSPIASATSTNVSSRLPNSMRPWMPYSGTGT